MSKLRPSRLSHLLHGTGLCISLVALYLGTARAQAPVDPAAQASASPGAGQVGNLRVIRSGIKPPQANNATGTRERPSTPGPIIVTAQASNVAEACDNPEGRVFLRKMFLDQQTAREFIMRERAKNEVPTSSARYERFFKLLDDSRIERLDLAFLRADGGQASCVATAEIKVDRESFAGDAPKTEYIVASRRLNYTATPQSDGRVYFNVPRQEPQIQMLTGALGLSYEASLRNADDQVIALWKEAGRQVATELGIEPAELEARIKQERADRKAEEQRRAMAQQPAAAPQQPVTPPPQIAAVAPVTVPTKQQPTKPAPWDGTPVRIVNLQGGALAARSDPSMTAPIVRMFSADTTDLLLLASQDDGWGFVRHGGETGWVRKQFLAKDEGAAANQPARIAAAAPAAQHPPVTESFFKGCFGVGSTCQTIAQALFCTKRQHMQLILRESPGPQRKAVLDTFKAGGDCMIIDRNMPLRIVTLPDAQKIVGVSSDQLGNGYALSDAIESFQR